MLKLSPKNYAYPIIQQRTSPTLTQILTSVAPNTTTTIRNFSNIVRRKTQNENL